MVNIMSHWVMTAVLGLLHPFFISVIEMNHNPKDAAVEISVRIFSNDFEKTLKQFTSGKIDIQNPSDKALLDKQISQYITEKLKLKINGQPVVMQYIGHEIQQESVWSYFEISKVSDMKKLEVDCSLLYDFEKSQSNIFHVKNKGKDKSFKLENPIRNTVFDF